MQDRVESIHRAPIPTTGDAITLRPATTTDEPFLLTLRKQTMTHYLEEVGAPTDDDTHFQRIRFCFDEASIVEDAGTPVGLLKVHRHDAEWMIVQIQLLPSHQGRGLGEQLIRRVLDDANAAGVPVLLKVLRSNPVRRLYDRLGFHTISDDGTEFTMRWHP